MAEQRREQLIINILNLTEDDNPEERAFLNMLSIEELEDLSDDITLEELYNL